MISKQKIKTIKENIILDNFSKDVNLLVSRLNEILKQFEGMNTSGIDYLLNKIDIFLNLNTIEHEIKKYDYNNLIVIKFKISYYDLNIYHLTLNY